MTVKKSLSPTQLHNATLSAGPEIERTKPVRIGIVGCGNVMDGAYMPLLQKLQQKGLSQVVGASHTTKDRCLPILEKWAIPKYFSCYQELCHSPEIDLVVILTPVKQHTPIAREALLAGKHVLLEKPMGVSLDEARELMNAARHASGLPRLCSFRNPESYVPNHSRAC